MADDSYTPAQKAKISRHFVLNAPHGEAQEIVKDLKKVAPLICTEQWAVSSLEEYNKRKFLFVTCKDGSKTICCPQSEVRQNCYLNPTTKKIVEIDPIEQKVLNEFDASNEVASGRIEEYRAALDEQLQTYLKDYFEDGKRNPASRSRGCGSVYASADQNNVAIVITFKNLNISNYWTGGWQSEWIFTANEGTTQLNGRVRLNVHYFEDGNVQLNGIYSRQESINVLDPSSTAGAIIEKIRDLENEFQRNLEQFYVEMHESSFKNMRRFLPKIGKKMDWRASVHQLIQQAASSS